MESGLARRLGLWWRRWGDGGGYGFLDTLVAANSTVIFVFLLLTVLVRSIAESQIFRGRQWRKVKVQVELVIAKVEDGVHRGRVVELAVALLGTIGSGVETSLN